MKKRNYMQTIKIKRKIISQNLRISELKEFIGKYVEITVRESTLAEKKNDEKRAAGLLSKYKDQNKIKIEKQAWQNSIIEKHGNS